MLPSLWCQGRRIMTNDKRYVLCWLLIFAWLMALPYVMKLAGIDIGGKKPPVVPPAQIAADKDKDKAAKARPCQSPGAGDKRARGQSGRRPGERCRQERSRAGDRQGGQGTRGRGGRGGGAGARLGHRSIAGRVSARGPAHPEGGWDRVGLFLSVQRRVQDRADRQAAARR